MSQLESEGATGRGITHTFRLDADVKSRLDELSNKQNRSVNSLGNKALRKYVEWDFTSEQLGNMTLSPRLLTKLMDHVSVEEARRLGEWASVNVFNDLVQFLFQKQTLTSIIATLALLDKYAGAFSLEHNFSYPEHTLIILHKMGIKWSCFYETLIASLFRQIAGPVESVKTSSSENQVVITVQIRQTE